MRIHIPSLPHTETTSGYEWCAYTAKVKKFCSMMTDAGHEVILYAGSRNEAKCADHVEVMSEGKRKQYFSDYNWDTDIWNGFQIGAPWWRDMNTTTIKEMKKRQQPGDFLGVIAGRCQEEISVAFPEMPCVEWGIGYAGVYADHRVFESYAWMHHLAANEPTDDIRFFDAVIPNFFDPADFLPRLDDDGYLLFLGRHTPRKGLEIVKEIAARVDVPVLTAGQGDLRIPGCEYLGVVKGKEKAQLIAGAQALLAPTTYLEPFGGVAVEAMLSGTPAITTDYGAFTETIEDGVSGFRCRTLAEFLRAVDKTNDLDRLKVLNHAQKYTMDSIAPRYTSYFDRVSTRWGEGWYA